MLERFRVQVGDGHVGQKLDALNTDDVALGDRRKAKKTRDLFSAVRTRFEYQFGRDGTVVRVKIAFSINLRPN